MAFSNLTAEDPKQTSYEELACSTEFTGQVHNHLIVFLALNSFMAITAFLGNALILVALHKVSSLHAPSKLLFRSLAVTDLCIGLIVQPVSVSYFLLERTMEYDLPLRIGYFHCRSLYSEWCIFVYTDHNKHGQISGPVVGAQIQTSNF